MALHKHCKGDWKRAKEDAGLSDDELQAFLDYAAQFLGNTGNYKSFGDSKFIPRIDKRQLKALATISPDTLSLYEKIKDSIFESEPIGLMHLGYPDAGHLSTYYPDSPDITKEEITIISDFLESKTLLPENTRIRKVSGGYEVLIASASKDPSQSDRDVPDSEWTLDGKLTGKRLKLVFGDYSAEMEKITEAMENSEKHAINDTERSMCAKYVQSFKTGSLEAYKDSQRFWIRNKKPMVETDIGFVEVSGH